jgi:hypothetical protein
MFKALTAFTCLVVSTTALAGPLLISTGKLEADYAYTPLEFEVRGLPASIEVGLVAVPTGEVVPCQVVERTERSVRFAWLAGSLKKDAEAVWKLGLLPREAGEPADRVVVEEAGPEAIRVTIDGKEFTRLVAAADDYKPFFFPVMGPNGKIITRQYPMHPGVEGEAEDHRHHRSMWFNHGSVGGVDFWLEGQGKGRIRQTRIRSLSSGPVFGRIATDNEWVTPDGETLLDDSRVITFYPLARGQVLLDLTITLKPRARPVRFGDTKEGSFGIRVAASMKEKHGGTIRNSRGQEGMKGVWGKPAEWVDYYGKVGGDTVGVAIFDHPSSFRHPTTWHVRDYGLFAANPFGYRAFKHGTGDGSHTLGEGEALELRYGIYIHHDTTGEARVEKVYRGFASPPALHPRAVR